MKFARLVLFAVVALLALPAAAHSRALAAVSRDIADALRTMSR